MGLDRENRMKTIKNLLLLSLVGFLGCSQAPPEHYLERLDVSTSPKKITVNSEHELVDLVKAFGGPEADIRWLECMHDVDKDHEKDVAFYAGNISPSEMIYYVMHSSDLSKENLFRYTRMSPFKRNNFGEKKRTDGIKTNGIEGSLTYPLVLHKAVQYAYP